VNVLNRRHAHQEVLGRWLGTGKRIPLRKCRKLQYEVKGGRPVRGTSLHDMSPFRNFWSQIFIWGRPSTSAPSAITASWWISCAPEFFIQKYFTRNLYSSFSIYHRWQSLQIC
jgi:hypothetical protein